MKERSKTSRSTSPCQGSTRLGERALAASERGEEERRGEERNGGRGEGRGGERRGGEERRGKERLGLLRCLTFFGYFCLRSHVQSTEGLANGSLRQGVA